LTQATAESGPAQSEWSLIDASGNGMEISAALIQDGHLLVRLFNAEGNESPTEITLSPQIKNVIMIELDGRVIAELPLSKNGSGQQAVTLSIPRFAVRTLRCGL
jgi:alpha-mannosidase